MTAVTPVEESTTFITDFGPVPSDTLELTKSKYEVRMYRMSTERTKQLGEALGFSAQFDSEEVFDAFADVWKDEGYITFEMKSNTRPMTISLRYKSDRWSPVETHTPNKRETESEMPKTRGVKTIYHAFLDTTVLDRLAELLRVKPESLTKLFYRINLKTKTFALAAADDAVEHFPEAESFKTAIIPRKTIPTETQTDTTDDTTGKLEHMSDQDDANDSVEDLSQNSAPAAELTAEQNAEQTAEQTAEQAAEDVPASEAPAAEKPAVEKPVETLAEKPAAEKSAAKFEQSSAKSFDATPSARPERAPMRAEPAPKQSSSSSSSSQPKYHTYSQSEVDNLIRRSAENITSSVTTKINQQTKTVEKNLKNQEYAFNQTLEKLTKQMEQANAKLDKASNDLNAGSAKQMEEFRSQLNKELDDFKSNFDKKVVPGIKLLDARLEQLAEVKKQNQTQTIGGMNPGVLVGVVVAIVIIAVVNLVISWYAFERISNLEKSHAELMMKSVPSGTSDVPVPDLMKDQIDKEQKSTPTVSP
ncbi:hypothetical protein KF728_27215 [Candidatus Obscuribacterales bacterium]|nr:hypothetical protein [Candidatus Obscuribacterales bacterium]